MLRQVIDWAANRSTDLLTRYKQMATNIGLSENFSTCEYNEMSGELRKNKRTKGSVGDRARGRRSERSESGEPFQARPESKKRRRRQARRREGQPSSVAALNSSASSSDGKRRCSPAGRTPEDVSKSFDFLELGGLRLFFNSRVRLPLTSTAQRNDDPEWGNRETYAEIVKTPKMTREEWLNQLSRQTEMMMCKLDQWRSKFKIFSVSIETTGRQADELGDANRQNSLKHQILVQRLKKELRQYFGEISQIDELVVCQNGTKHKSVYLGPTEKAVENITKSNESLKKTRQTNVQVQITMKMVHESSVSPTAAELEDSFSDLEDKFWSKHDHYLKRKSGKASRKRLRAPGPGVAKLSKSEIALMKSECVLESKDRKSELRSAELSERKLQRRDSPQSDSANYSKRMKCQSTSQENAVPPLPKRLALMQEKCRRYTKKIEKARLDEKLPTVHLKR
ncbi:hypothetical protein GE061_005690 [Apolygus lucorum]|uniref:Uncharacterized protein n=1 Tax=Apolygus lucorum TaxID=248454 RepID=A0A6A4J4L6_APOLU|nr:hypothetical protein GE061_005690 [Apolygus lucorum]